MVNIIRHIAEHLEFEGIGKLNTDAAPGDIFWGEMPDKPDTAICVFSTDSSYAGSPDGGRFQIVTRAKSIKTAYELSQSIAETLAEFNGFLHGDGPHVIIDVTNASAQLGKDDKQREEVSSNFTIKYCDFGG